MTGASPLLLLAVLLGACTAVVDADSYRVEGAGGCDPITNAGCGAGQACFALISTGERLCQPEGARATGMTCSAMGDCVQGATCFFFAPERGLCLDYCRSDADCGRQPASIGCNLNDATGIGSCFQGCDPADPASCGSGVACFAMGTASACNTTGPTGLGQPCGFTFEDACAPGLMCLANAEGVNACFAQCGPGLPACSGGQVCTFALGDTVRPAMPGEWGACATLT